MVVKKAKPGKQQSIAAFFKPAKAKVDSVVTQPVKASPLPAPTKDKDAPVTPSKPVAVSPKPSPHQTPSDPSSTLAAPTVTPVKRVLKDANGTPKKRRVIIDSDSDEGLRLYYKLANDVK